MNKKIILDASALLALLNEEPGYQLVEEKLPDAIMSTVNISETIAVLTNIGVPENDAKNLSIDLIKEIIPFDIEQAFIAAALRLKTKPYGLSFGDRACLALSKIQKLPVLTADKIWGKMNMDGIHIQVIR